jgi:GH25 family lysozyme M1 (1,4-beta-N-acetylmuramidase)
LGTATSANGVPTTVARSVTFRIARSPQPVPASARPAPKPVLKPHVIGRPATGGSRPIPAPTTPAPTLASLEGVDVSHHEGQIDWQQVASSGKGFAYLKASEGTGFVDWTYATNRTLAGRAGIRIGAFHYAQPDRSPGEAVAEADHFIAAAGFRPGDLVPMLDLEVTNGLSPTELQVWVTAFLDRVLQRTGVRAGIYVSPSFWSGHLADTSAIESAGYRVLWIADWRAGRGPQVPASDWGGQGWALWQFDHRAVVPGIAVPVDVDRLSAGALAELIIH